MKHINIRRWLLAVIATPALLLSGQPATDTIPTAQNQFSVDLQFLGRGESRYGGMPEKTIVEVDEEGYEIENEKIPQSNFLLSRTRLPINFKRDWLEVRVTPQHSGVWGQAGKGAFNLSSAGPITLLMSACSMGPFSFMYSAVSSIAISHDIRDVASTIRGRECVLSVIGSSIIYMR